MHYEGRWLSILYCRGVVTGYPGEHLQNIGGAALESVAKPYLLLYASPKIGKACR